jgi:hypothetical protein
MPAFVSPAKIYAKSKILSSVGRNPFTSDEDKLLVKYLAKYNPEVKGRSGNRVYKALVENVCALVFLSSFPAKITRRSTTNGPGALVIPGAAGASDTRRISQSSIGG